MQAEGKNVGKYVNLDFGHLKYLSSIDRQFREALVLATADIEHFAKESVIARAAAEGEDGYAIVSDYLASLSHGDRNLAAQQGVHPSVMQKLAGRSTSRLTMDVYAHANLEDKRRAMDSMQEAFTKNEDTKDPKSTKVA